MEMGQGDEVGVNNANGLKRICLFPAKIWPVGKMSQREFQLVEIEMD